MLFILTEIIQGAAKKQEIIKQLLIQTLHLQNYIVYIVTKCYGADITMQVAACPPPQQFQEKPVQAIVRFSAAPCI